MSPICIALSADATAHPYHATLIASILRRASRPLHVRCWCRGFLPESFERERLKVEFFAAGEEVKGRFPGYVGPAVFDRLRVIREAEDWERCLVMDYDQLALCDLAPLMELELGDALLAAKMQGPGVDMAYAMREWIKRPFPAGWEGVADFPYFSMGPLMNLAAMRDAGTWERLLAAQEAFGMDEQLALTAASEGRTIGFDRKWNLFPKSDLKGDEVPEGVIHWLGWPKPWHRNARVWRPDVWEAERASWEHLRLGIWEKPLAVELEPEDEGHVHDLAARGWRVRVLHRDPAPPAEGEAGEAGAAPRLPDVKVSHGATAADFHQLLECHGGEIERVRLGPWTQAADWLDGVARLPRHVVAKGTRTAAELDSLRELGNAAEARVMTGEWPGGGPLPRVLDHGPPRHGTGCGPDEEVFMHWGAEPAASVPRLLRVAARRMRVAEPRTVGVVLSRACPRQLRPQLRSLRLHFLAGHELRIFVAGTREELAGLDGLEGLPVERLEWPEDDDGRDRELAVPAVLAARREAFAGVDFLVEMDPSLRVVSAVGEELLVASACVRHAGFVEKRREEFTYERNPASAAWIGPGEGRHYLTGLFKAGEREWMIGAWEAMAAGIARDRAAGIRARWGVESHWNRLLVERPPALVLPPTYGQPAREAAGGEVPRIQISRDRQRIGGTLPA